MRRLAVAALTAAALAGCSGTRTVGVTTNSDGAVEVLSSCDDVGIAEISVFEAESRDLLVQLRPLGPRDDLPARVVITSSSPTHEAVVTAGLPLSGVISVWADYPLAATFTEEVRVDVDELSPDVVATTAVVDGGLETRFQPRDRFEAFRSSCLGPFIPWPVWLGFLLVAGAGALTAGVAIWRFVRKPEPTAPVSRLPHPPSRPRS